MKRYFVETNAYNTVVWVDENGKGFCLLNLEFENFDDAKNADYSNIDGFTTIDDFVNEYPDGNVFDFDETEFENVTEF